MSDGLTRRGFCGAAAAVAAVSGHRAAPARGAKVSAKAPAEKPFALEFIVASSLYGRLPLADVVAEVPEAGSRWIDIWPEGHANQREQMEKMGHDAFAALLKTHGVKLGILTHYDLGPLKLQPEMKVAQKFGTRILISGAIGPRDKKGPALKKAVAEFLAKMKPHIAAAEKTHTVIGIENHGHSLIQSADSIRWLAELRPSKHIGVALAPYHMPQDPALIAKVIEDVGDGLVHFYAWQHGKGCMKKLPKAEELMQMPGRGTLDFVPIVAALKKIRYAGWTSVFMHPVPRGIPILPTAKEVTAEIVRAQKHLQACLAKA